MKKHLAMAMAACGLLWAGTGIAQAQGSLTPPGAPAATMKSLDQIEPRQVITNLPAVLSSPGSYVVTRNLSLVSGNGISVTASDVTIDLNGFVLTGDPVGSGHGIYVAPGVENATIRNGVLRNWGADGVHAHGTDNVRIDNLRVHGCTGDGIEMSRGTVSRIVSSGNGGAGLRPKNDPIPGIDIVVEKNPSGPIKLVNNGGGGVVAEGPGSIQLDGGDISGNTGHGISWISDVADASHRLVLGGVTCDDNTLDGIHMDLSGVAAKGFHDKIKGSGKSRCGGNGGNGIHIAASAVNAFLKIDGVDGEFSNNGGNGVSVIANAVDCFLQIKGSKGTFVNNGGHGIYVDGGTKGSLDLEGGTFADNTGAGLSTRQTQQSSFGTLVRNGSVSHNGGGGIVVEGSGSLRVGGTVSGNTGHGISWSPLNPGDRITFKAKEGASVHNTGDGLHFASPGPVDAVCDLAEFSFERNGGDGVHIQLPHPDSYLSILHHQGRLMDNAGDGMDITAGRSGNQGFFDVAMARNAGRGCGKIDGGSNPGSFVRCVVQDNGLGGLDLEGGSWTLADSVIKNNGGDGVAVGAKIHTRTGHVTLMKRGCTVEDNQGHGVRVYPAETGASAHVVVEHSRATGNTGSGFLLDAGAAGSGTFRDSVVQNNDGRGLDLAGGTWTLEGSAVNDNGSDGIVVAAKKHTRTGHVTLIKRGCAAARNGGDGVHVSSAENDAACRVVIEHSLLNGNTGSGLHLETTHPGSVASLSWLNSHAGANDAHGVVVTGSVGTGKGSVTIRGGDCDDSGSHAIVIAHPEIDTGLITGVSAARNGGAGIVSSSHSISIVGNTLSRNAAAGIRVEGDGHYLADNRCLHNHVGIELAGNQNALAQNVYSGGSAPYVDFSGTNPSAPIQDVTVGVNPLGNIIY